MHILIHFKYSIVKSPDTFL